MNGIVLTGRFCQTLALYITCHLTPASLCLCKAIKRVSEDARAPCDTKQTPSLILYLRLLGEMEWGNAARLTWYVLMWIHSSYAFCLSHTHTYTNAHTGRIVWWISRVGWLSHVNCFFPGQTHRSGVFNYISDKINVFLSLCQYEQTTKTMGNP